MRLPTSSSTALALLLGACAGGQSAQPTASGGSADEVGALAAQLRSQGATVRVKGPISESFFSAPGRLLTVNGAQIRVLHFASAPDASAAAGAVSPDGYSVGASAGNLTTITQVGWVSRPHFYRSGSLIVLYVGDNGPTRQLLKATLGPPFAGEV